ERDAEIPAKHGRREAGRVSQTPTKGDSYLSPVAGGSPQPGLVLRTHEGVWKGHSRVPERNLTGCEAGGVLGQPIRSPIPAKPVCGRGKCGAHGARFGSNQSDGAVFSGTGHGG